MRLFIAVSFNEEIKNILFDLSEKLKKIVDEGSFTIKDNFHITLLYIGEATKYDDIISCIESIKVSPFTICFDTLGRFVGKSESTYWVGLKGQNDMLVYLHETMKKRLFELGFSLNQLTFNPHITLARKVKNDKQLIDFEVPKANIKVSKIILYQSEFKENKLTYTILYEKELK